MHLAPWIPHNGSSHNLRGPLKKFRRAYQPRRQMARAAHRPGPEDKKSVGGGLRSQLDRDLVRFRGLLCGGAAKASTSRREPAGSGCVAPNGGAFPARQLVPPRTGTVGVLEFEPAQRDFQSTVGRE